MSSKNSSEKEIIEEVEILNSSEHPEITGEKAKSSEHQQASPLETILENVEELKKIRGFFLASILMGFTGLFVFHLSLGIAAIVFGLLDLRFGSKFTRKASYFGIIMGLLSVLLGV